MSEEITFIHAADLHLDSPFKGLAHTPEHIFKEIKESTFIALSRLVTKAIEKQVDFVLITGDLFDNEKQSLKAQISLRKAFERLRDENIAVYLSYGNHDYIQGNQHQVTYPDNVFIFPDETVRSFIYEREGVALASISGFSYVNRKVEENKTEEYHIQESDIPFHIAMLHGSVQGNTEHDTYAPFLLSELTRKNFDYWALGHIHKRTILNENPHVVYSGNTQGRHRKEDGEKGCYYVQLSSGDVSLEFLPLQHIEFSSLSIDVSHCKDLFQIETFILEAIKQQKQPHSQLIDIALYSNHKNLRIWQTTGQLDEMKTIINESLYNTNLWQFIFRISSEVATVIEDEESYYGEHFLGELQRRFEGEEIDIYLEELYRHPQARKYLSFPTEEEKEVYRKKAKHRLMDKLLRGGN